VTGQVLVKGTPRTVPEMKERAARLASGLSGLGVERDSAVMGMLANGHAFYETAFAARRLGARFVPVSTQLRRDELRYIVEDCRPAVAVVGQQSAAVVRASLPEDKVLVTGADYDGLIAGSPEWPGRAVDAPAPMLYTSGTTGRPKGVRKGPPTKEQIRATAAWVRVLFSPEDGMRTVIANPLYHSAAWGFSLVALQHHGVVVLEERFDAERLLALVDEHRVTHLQLVPTMMHRLLRLPDRVRSQYDVSSLRHVVHGAGPCSQSTKRAMIAWWGPVLHEYYGSTETGAIVSCSSPEWLERPGTVGRPRDGAVVRILDDQGRELPAGEVGTVWVWHPAMTPFDYHNVAGDPAPHGLATCGDLGRVDPDGYLYLSDRRTDLIVCGGVNVYPAEVELALAELPGVYDCAVIGIRDAEMGQVPVAVVEPEAGADLTLASLRAGLADRLAPTKVPRRLVLVDSFPRQVTGKVRRAHLRDLLETAEMPGVISDQSGGAG
jgi:long-chain acyl-CoA synthetase